MGHTRVLIRLVALSLLAVAVAAPTRPTTITTNRATTRPVVAVTYEHSYPPPGTVEPRRLIIAIYANGELRWSDDQRNGGAPYRAARVAPARVARLLDDLEAIGFFTDPDVERHQVNYGPDASYTVLAAERGEARQRLASWHDPVPTGFTYITEQGITTIQPGQPAPQPSKSYKRFTQVWGEARRLIYDVLPQSEDPVDPRVFDVGRSAGATQQP
jgi:hypothetical protein